MNHRVLVNINLAKLQYRWARNALYRLKGHGDWENQLRVLEDKHVTGLNERMLTAQEQEEADDIRERGLLFMAQTGPLTVDALTSQGEGHREVSWIWYSFPKGGSPMTMTGDDAFKSSACIFHSLTKILTQSFYTGLKREWAKARARMLRWREEIELVVEEMRRVVAFNTWKADWWERRATARANVSDELREGLVAVALSSSAHLREKAGRLEAAWAPLVAMASDVLKDLQSDRSIAYELDAGALEDDPDEDDTLFDDDDSATVDN